MNERERLLVAALEDAHDALGELMSSPVMALDWDDLAAYLGNDAWIGLRERINVALAPCDPGAGVTHQSDMETTQ